MATLDEKITRVENNVTASLEAAAEMGAEVPAGANSDSLPTLIRSIPKGGGASSWNDLPDRPVVLEGTPDTLTWDGNTEGLVSIKNDDMIVCKVSDATPSIEDCANGATMVVSSLYGGSDAAELAAEDIVSLADGLVAIGEVFSVRETALNVEHADLGGIIFTEPGTYFMAMEGAFYVSSLTIPGYTGFAQEKIAPSHLYQPDWNQTDESAPDFVKNKPFGETIELVDKLTWDGTQTGTVVNGMFQFMSPTVLTKDDCSSGGRIVAFLGELQTFEFSGEEAGAMFMEDGLANLMDGLVIVIPRDNYVVDGIPFPYAGLYFIGAYGSYVSEFSVNNFAAFEVSTVKQLEAKFIPVNDLPLGVGRQTDGGEIFNIGQDNSNTATGYASHAEGADTQANGDYSHAEGYGAIANGWMSHAEGFHTLATRDYQHVQGLYNEEDTEKKYLHIVGNGSGDTDRRNAHTIDWAGNAWFAGNVYTGGTGQHTGVKLEGLPSYTAADEGKVLKIVNGVPTWVAP